MLKINPNHGKKSKNFKPKSDNFLSRKRVIEREISHSEVPVDSAQGDAPSKPPKIVSARIVALSKVDDCPSVRDGYEAVIGHGGPLVELATANEVVLQEVERQVTKSLSRILLKQGQDWGAQTTRVGVVPGSAAEIDVPKARKLARFYAQAEVDSISVIIFRPVALTSDPHGFGLAIDLAAMMFGSEVHNRMSRAELKEQIGRKERPLRSKIRWYEADDAEALEAELANMFRPSLIKDRGDEGFPGDFMPANWDKASVRHVRGLITLMARSMSPLKRVLAVNGDGRSVTAGAIAAAEVNMKKALRGHPPVIHPDGFAHFWFAELRRLGFDDVSVPLIKLR